MAALVFYAAGALLAPEMRCGQAAAFAQKVRKTFPRLDVSHEPGAIHSDRHGRHRLRISRTARRSVDACKRRE